MRYSSYKAKYAGTLKKLNFIHKFRFVFLGVGAAAVVSTGTLVGLKGKVGETTSSKDTYKVGEAIKVDSSAFMSDYFIEYAKKDGSDWSLEAPKRPGEYQARAVSKGGFGSTKYGKVTYFTIEPADLHLPISSSKITYGEEPVLDRSDADKKKLQINNVSYTYGAKFDETNPFGESQTFSETATLNSQNLRIVDATGADVTDYYKVVSEPKALEVNKREIVVDVFGKTKVYDGSALSSNDYKLNENYSLAFDDQLSLDTSVNTEQTEIGETENVLKFKVTRGEVDKTAFYKIVTNNGKLVVSKRSLTISTNSLTREYNGYAVSYGSQNPDNALSYDISGDGLLTGHSIKNIEFDLNNTFITNGARDNTISTATLEIVDKEDNPVNDIYKINVVPGKVNLLKKSIEIKYSSSVYTYDGLEHVSNAPEVVGGNEKLAPTDELRYDPTKRTDPTNGSVQVEQNHYIVNKELDDLDVTSYYNINVVQSGTLSIEKIPFIVKTNKVDFTYNGEPLSENSETNENKLTFSTEGTLLDSHEFVLTEGSNGKHFSLEGKKMVTGDARNVLSFDIQDKSTHASVIDKYQITTDFPIAKISKRKIEVSFDLNSKYYDNTQHEYKVDGVIEEGELVSGDNLVIENNYLTGSGSFYPILEVYRGGDIISGDGPDSCYNVSYTTSQLNRVELNITSNDITGTYDGVAYSSSSEVASHKLTVAHDQLLEGHKLSVSFDIDKIDFFCGESSNSFTYQILDEHDEPVPQPQLFYNIHTHFGQINVKRRPVQYEISTDNLTKLYDGLGIDPILIDSEVVGESESGLLYGDYFENPEGIGGEPVTSQQKYYYPVIRDALGNNVTSNYLVYGNNHGDYSNYYMTISKRQIRIRPNSYTKTYDALDCSEQLSYEVVQTDGYADSSHYLDVTYSNSSAKNAGTYQNTISAVVRDGYGNSLSSYYDVIVENSPDIKITINKRTLVVDEGTSSSIYNGQSQTVSYDPAHVSGLVKDDVHGIEHTLTLIGKTNVGSYTWDGLFTIEDQDENSVKDNYTVDTNIRFNITKCEVNYYLTVPDEDNTYTKTYDGSPITMSDFSPVVTTNLPGNALPLGYSYSFSIDESQYVKATSKKKVTYSFNLYHNGYPLSTEEKGYFNINHSTDNDGYIEISKRALTVNASYSGQYDSGYHGGDYEGYSTSGLSSHDYIYNVNFNRVIDYTTAPVNASFKSNLTIYNSLYNYNVTDCYDVTLSGQYSVGKRDITINLPSISKTYDGTPFTVSDVTNGSGFYVNGLQGNDTLTYTLNENIKNFTNGEVGYSLTPHITRGGKDVSSNYNIYFSGPATAQIDKLDVTFNYYHNNSTLTYDGTVKTLSYFASWGSSNLGIGEEVRCKVDKKLQNTLEYDSSERIDIDLVSQSDFINYFDIGYYSNSTFFSTVDNYNIHVYNYYGDGHYSYSLSKRPLNLAINGLSKVFDGGYYDNKNVYDNSSGYNVGLVAGHTINAQTQLYRLEYDEILGDYISTIVDDNKVKDAGEYVNNIEGAHIYSGTKDVTANYEISYSPAYVNIFQRVIRYAVLDSAFSYGNNTSVPGTCEFYGNNSYVYLKITNYAYGYGSGQNDLNEFLSNYDVSGNFTPSSRPDDITEENGSYSFYMADGTQYTFACEMKAEGDETTYSSNYQVGDENVIFVPETNYDDTLNIATSPKKLTIKNVKVSPIGFDGVPLDCLEQLYTSGLRSGDILKIGNEEYNKNKKEYEVLKLNKAYSPGWVTLHKGDKDYYDDVLNDGTVGSTITVWRKVYVSNGMYQDDKGKYNLVNVTACYDIHFEFDDMITFQVIG